MQDYQRRFVDTWVLMSMIAASTSRIGLFPDVTNLPLRPPAVLAKAGSSADEARRFKAPAAYEGPSPVPQPPYDPSGDPIHLAGR